MGQAEDLRLFITIVEAGSVSKAAIELNIAKSAVSRRLALLEERYETKLIERSPGLWEVTQTGKELYQRALSAVGEIDEIETDFVSASAELSGPLSVSVPQDFGLSYLKEALITFKTQYPDIALTVDYDDRIVDLDRENYDFVIRITGSLSDDVSAESIRPVTHALYASPSYLEKNDTPQHLRDLEKHSLLHFGPQRKATWKFIDSKGKKQQLEFRPFLNSNSGLFLLDAAIRGVGICRLPDFIIQRRAIDGSLVRILPDFREPDWGIYLLSAKNRRLNRRMRVFAEEMKRACLPHKDLKIEESQFLS